MPAPDNIFWHALTGTQAHLAVGSDGARRYRRGGPAIMAFPDAARPDLAAIAPHCDVGERVYCVGWKGPMPEGWKLEVDTSVFFMTWGGQRPEVDARTVRLDASHVPALLELLAATRPGPFSKEPLGMGEWHGIFEGDRLVAAAGERMHAGSHREISGVCTLPEFQGRGFGRVLTERLVASQLDRGFTPCLHVNLPHAKKLYDRIGFAVESESPLRVVSKLA